MSSDSIVRKVLRKETSRRESSRSKGAVCYEFDREGERTRVRIDRSEDPRAHDVIETSEPDARDYSDPIPEYPLPGAGETREDCGELFEGIFCEGCGKPHEVGRTCRNPDCPRCWQSWAFHRGKSIASKIEALGREEYAQNGKKVKQHHITVSLRDSTRFNSKDPLKKAREAIKPLLAKVGVDTGYIIPHLFRIKEEYRGDVLGHESGSGELTWKNIPEKVESESISWEEIREEYLVYAPHFHVIALSEFVDTTGVGEIEDKTGVVIHRITTKREDGKERSIANTEELCKVVAYSLSHTSIRPESERKTHRAAVRPFGKVANFEAWDGVKADVDEAMREVAGTVLGVSFAPPECNEPVPCDHEHDHSASESRSSGFLDATRYLGSNGSGGSGSSGSTSSESSSESGGSSSWEETAGIVPAGLNTQTEGQTETCSGKLAPIWKAESRLGDLDWISRIEDAHGEERLRDLRGALEDWREMGSPRPPEVAPPDE